MHTATWIPLHTAGDSPESDAERMSEEDFRVMFKTAIQRLIMGVFFDEIRSFTGSGSLKEVLARLDINVTHDAELRTWYARARGERFPRPEVVNEIQAHVPGLKFSPHHPMLRWLASPSLDERTVRRLQSRMPLTWHELVVEIKSLPVHELTVSPELFVRLRLERLNYLDVLFAFARARSSTRCCDTRRKALNRILWTLPILYPDDPMWATGSLESRSLLMGLIDHALGLREADGPRAEWRGTTRIGYIASQHWRLEQHVAAHPCALRSQVLRRRYWAKIWRWR